MFFALSAWKILFLRLCQESPFYMINRHICIYMKRLSLHLSSLPVCSGVPVTRSLVLCACFVDRCLSFSLFSFGHCVVSSSSIYEFWLLLWYLQILLSFIQTTFEWRHCIGMWEKYQNKQRRRSYFLMFVQFVLSFVINFIIWILGCIF